MGNELDGDFRNVYYNFANKLNLNMASAQLLKKNSLLKPESLLVTVLG